MAVEGLRATERSLSTHHVWQEVDGRLCVNRCVGNVCGKDLHPTFQILLEGGRMTKNTFIEPRLALKQAGCQFDVFTEEDSTQESSFAALNKPKGEARVLWVP